MGDGRLFKPSLWALPTTAFFDTPRRLPISPVVRPSAQSFLSFAMRSSVQTTGMALLVFEPGGQISGLERAPNIPILPASVQDYTPLWRRGFWPSLWVLLACWALNLAGGGAPAVAAERVLILSASSISTAVQEIADQISVRDGIEVRVSAASSGTLARQVSQGAPADLYISASPEWIERLTIEGKLDSDFIRPIARNRLVFVRPMPLSRVPLLDLSKPLDVLDALSAGRLAIGDPNHVPAGAYAQSALQNLQLWAAVRDRLAPQANVRAVLAMVERKETSLGIVYATDAALSRRVSIAAIIPAEAQPPIVYAAALIQGRRSEAATSVFEALSSEAGLATLERNGFGVSN